MESEHVEFRSDEWFDQHRMNVVWFGAVIDEKSVECGITIDALVEHCGGYRDDPLPAFRAHRSRIESVAARLIGERRFEDDGKILIRSSDFR